MASTSTSETGARKRQLIGRKKSTGQRRNGAISANVSKASNNNSVVLPRLEFEMALEITVPNEENWTAIVRDAAETAGGDLLFVLPYAENGDASTGTAPIEHAMVRLVEDGESRLLLVRVGAAGYHLVEEEAIDAGLVRFARASIDVLERLGSDNRVIAPLITLAKH